MSDTESIERIVAANGDTAERLLQACGELSAAANKLAPVHSSTSAAVTLNGGGIMAAVLAVVAIISCTIAVCGLMLTSRDYANLQREVDQLRSDVATQQIYITEFRRNQKPKE